MPKTIKESLESILATQRHLVEEGFHSRVVADEKVIEQALAEIRQLLKECEPEYNEEEYLSLEVTTRNAAIADYTANIEERLG